MVRDVSARDAPGARPVEDSGGTPTPRDPGAAFFRDPELFTYLREQALPAIIADARKRDNALRLWSAGCATGEEAYSLAILVAEALGDELERYTVRIFATDPTAEALAFARRGVYSATSVQAVPAPLRDRYFAPCGEDYEVTKRVRDLVIFGWHDLMQRPPFPRIDLVLYRDSRDDITAATRQPIAARLFAHALRDGGYLAFGDAEIPELLADYFSAADDALHVYRRHGDRPPPIVTHRMGGHVDAPELVAPPRGARSTAARHAADDVLPHLPAGVVVVDRRYDILSINGLARRLFGIHGAALGEDFIHLLHGVSPQPLRAAIDAALRDGQTQTLDAVPAQAVAPGETRYLRISCAARENGADDAPSVVVIVAMDVTDTVLEQQERGRADAGQQAEVARLTGVIEQLSAANNELMAANEQLARDNTLLHRSNDAYLGAVEEAQVAAEEIETLNEELQATNEELQATGEEMEALNAELQMTNAVLAGTNAALEQRNDEIQELAGRREEQRRRLAAILSSMSEAVVVLDREGQTIFTSAAFHRMFGRGGATFAPADMEGHLLPSEATPQWRAARGEPFQMEFTLLGPDEQRHWYEAAARPVRAGEADDESRDSVLVIRDITDRSLRHL